MLQEERPIFDHISTKVHISEGRPNSLQFLTRPSFGNLGVTNFGLFNLLIEVSFLNWAFYYKKTHIYYYNYIL